MACFDPSWEFQQFDVVRQGPKVVVHGVAMTSISVLEALQRVVHDSCCSWCSMFLQIRNVPLQ